MSDSESVEYSRRLYDNVLGWYKNADSKAQVILGFVGAFLAFLVSLIFRKPTDLQAVIKNFNWETYLFIGPMLVCLVIAVACALSCIWSRLIHKSKIDSLFTDLKIHPTDTRSWKPEIMWFFQMINHLMSERLADGLLRVNNDFEIRALASQIAALSKNVERKHRLVNRGFVFTLGMLAFFLAAGVSFFVRAIP